LFGSDDFRKFQGAGKIAGEPAVNLEGVFWAVETKLFGFVECDLFT